jgi:NTE family protein
MATGREIFVLSGGGSRGAGQVGMLKALWDSGITPDLIVGGSVGAINACFMASHPTRHGVAELASRWTGMSEETLCGNRRRMVLNHARRRPHLLTADRLRRLVADWVPTFHLEHLEIPVRIATTDLLTGRAVLHERGYIPDLIAASAALPATFRPVLLPLPDGPTTQGDAGVAANVPLGGAREAPPPGDRVWALDVTRTPSAHRHLRNPLDVVIAALVASLRNREAADPPHEVDLHRVRLAEDADCGSVFDFTHTQDLFALGERAAAAEVTRVREVSLVA